MTNPQQEEYLEQLSHLASRGNDSDSIEDLAALLHGKFDMRVLEDLHQQGLLEFRDEGRHVVLTADGRDQARRLIRQHRLAECLIHDILGMKGDGSETAACEFEHLVAPELVESICILLGHPRECPHGHPIPRGECCDRRTRLVESSPHPLTDLKVSHSGQVAFVRCDRDDQIHRFDSLGIRPGAVLRLHQTTPTYVIECDGAHIALESRVAAQIHVWLDDTIAKNTVEYPV